MRVHAKSIELRFTKGEVFEALKEKYNLSGELIGMFDGDIEDGIDELSIILAKLEK